MTELNFNANEVDPATAYEPLPAGKYLAEITSSETKTTKSGNGNYLELEFTVLDGECQRPQGLGPAVYQPPQRSYAKNRPRETVGHLPRGGRDAASRLGRAA